MRWAWAWFWHMSPDHPLGMVREAVACALASGPEGRRRDGYLWEPQVPPAPGMGASMVLDKIYITVTRAKPTFIIRLTLSVGQF